MTEDDPGFAAIFAPYPSAYLSTAGAIFDSVILKLKKLLIKEYKNRCEIVGRISSIVNMRQRHL